MKPFLFKPGQVVPADSVALFAEACNSPTPGRSAVGKRRPIVALLIALLSLPAIGQQQRIGFWTVDGGGEISMLGGEWTLSGSLGQWDSSAGNAQSGGPWELTGGFWAIDAPAGDLLFKDQYEN